MRQPVRKVGRWLVALLVIATLLVLFASLSRRPIGAFALLITGIRLQGDDGVRVSLVLSNGTSHTLNVVDSVGGTPQIIFQKEGDTNFYWLTPLANRLSINLKPGTTTNTTVMVTNPPPKFRLGCVLRDLSVTPGTYVRAVLPNGVAPDIRSERSMGDPPWTGWIEVARLHPVDDGGKLPQPDTGGNR